MEWLNRLLGRSEARTPDANAGGTPLIRTDFSDDNAWKALLNAASTPSPDGFLANLCILNETRFDGILAEQIGKSATATDHAVLFIADQMTMRHPEHPFLCVNVSAPEQTFRVIASEVWGPENNLSLGNMDFHEFVDNAGKDGIFRGF